MPLDMGGIETERPQVVVWDKTRPEQREEAETRMEELRTQGFQLVSFSATNGVAHFMPPPRNENLGCMRILSQNGDDRLVWDRTMKDQVKEAFKKFKELMKKGYTAYAATSDGVKGHKITEFDPGLQEIILVPKTVPG